MKEIILGLIKFYKRGLSPFLSNNSFGFISPSCRFYPTCSDYALDSISKYGTVRGTLKAVGRILRCNPLVKAGIDEA